MIGGIGGKCTCLEPIAINKEWWNSKATLLFRLVLGKEKLKILVASSKLYLVFWSIYSILGTEQKPYLRLMWTVVGGPRVSLAVRYLDKSIAYIVIMSGLFDFQFFMFLVDVFNIANLWILAVLTCLLLYFSKFLNIILCGLLFLSNKTLLWP